MYPEILTILHAIEFLCFWNNYRFCKRIVTVRARPSLTSTQTVAAVEGMKIAQTAYTSTCRCRLRWLRCSLLCSVRAVTVWSRLTAPSTWSTSRSVRPKSTVRSSKVRREKIACAVRLLWFSIGSDVNLQVTLGRNVLISGDSGCGKSSLLRVLDGLWPVYSGNIDRNISRGCGGVLFLPQKPFLTNGSLREQVLCNPVHVQLRCYLPFNLEYFHFVFR